MSSSKFISSNEPVLDGNEKKYLLDVLNRNWLSFNGKYTKTFEEKFAEFVGTKYALACSSGTAALQMALLALGVGSGDEVIIPNFTIIASASSVIVVGAKPVLVDVDEYFCLDPRKIEEKITKKTKAIMVVHMYGQPANMPAILKIAKKHKLQVIEDCCAAHGAEVGGQMVGSFGDIGVFSFYTTKLIAMGEGGALVTNKFAWAQKIQSLRDYGHTQPRFVHRSLDFNYRLTDLQSAIGLAQLEKIGVKLAKKRQIADNYRKLLGQAKDFTLPQDPAWGKSSHWTYPLLINGPKAKKKNEIIKKMRLRGVEIMPFFVPMNHQPVFKAGKAENYPNVVGLYPISEDISARGVCIPSGLGLTTKQQKFVARNLLSLK